jgi:hypothetical protein
MVCSRDERTLYGLIAKAIYERVSIFPILIHDEIERLCQANIF